MRARRRVRRDRRRVGKKENTLKRNDNNIAEKVCKSAFWFSRRRARRPRLLTVLISFSAFVFFIYLFFFFENSVPLQTTIFYFILNNVRKSQYKTKQIKILRNSPTKLREIRFLFPLPFYALKCRNKKYIFFLQRQMFKKQCEK